MSKHQILTEDEFNNYKVNPKLIQLINQYQKEHHLSNEEISILDFGCGRGRSALKLRLEGYNAFGVDTDSEPIQNGIPLFSKFGHDGKKILSTIEVNCKTHFPDGHFDIIFSEQVVEHVSHLDLFLREVGRLTKPGGINYHIFPYKFHFKEQHLYMPVIHWLPKNKLREAFIFFYVLLGVEPHWKELEGKNIREKANIYYNYSISKTFYRTNTSLKKLFKGNHFQPRISNLRYPVKVSSLNTFFPHSCQIIAIKN